MTNDYGNLELHKVLLSAMKDVDLICREHGLKYYLHAGTLLGALNHQGFIPWDDDVDISLFREDYEKLLEIITEDYSDRYFVQNNKTESVFSHNRSVLRILGTRVIHNGEELEQHTEIGIDLVPLDSAPDSKLARWWQQHVILFWDMVTQIKLGIIIPSSIITRTLSLFAKMDRKRLGERIDKECMKYNKKQTKYVGLLSYTGKNPYTGKSGYENDLLLREWFENPIYVPFEDAEFMTISEPEKDLIHRYGPHWHDPYPEEKRVTKHEVKAYMINEEVRKRVGL